jgi:hypothetical protein
MLSAPLAPRMRRRGRGWCGRLRNHQVVRIGQQQKGFAPLIAIGEIPWLRPLNRAEPDTPRPAVDQVRDADAGVLHLPNPAGPGSAALCAPRDQAPLTVVRRSKRRNLVNTSGGPAPDSAWGRAPGSWGCLPPRCTRRDHSSPHGEDQSGDCVRDRILPILNSLAFEGGSMEKRLMTWWISPALVPGHRHGLSGRARPVREMGKELRNMKDVFAVVENETCAVDDSGIHRMHAG